VRHVHRMALLAVGAMALFATLGASDQAQAEPVAVNPQPAAATAAMSEAGCPLCHSHVELPVAPRVDSCAGCHQWVRTVAASPQARIKAMAVFPLWERYESTVQSYMPVPDLAAAMARLDPQWVSAYLDDPHDLRPLLPETMPRFQLTAAQRDTIAAAFGTATATVPATAAPDPSRIAEGEALFTQKGCVACHSFGGLHKGGIAAAPDLAHTRARVSADVVAAWISDPKALAPTATMPAMGLSASEVLAVRDYILLADPGGLAAPPPTALPAPLLRPVAWAEVEERVFGRICVHCHMDPALNQGRVGPGNGGGFGWPATGIELQTRAGVCANKGLIPAALERRRKEAPRDAVSVGVAPADLVRPKKPGMPLGLPPLDDNDTALVLAWFAQGCPE
jgi:mono/diheme cytochrome c family protein